jgi:hypothetical protein
VLKLQKENAPTTPAANFGNMYYGTDGLLVWQDENGLIIPVASAKVGLTADLAVTTSTTLANSTGLSFSVLSGVYYDFEFGVVWRTATATTGIKLGLTTPTFTVFSAMVNGNVAADGTAAEWTGSLTTSGDSSSLSGAEATNTDYIAFVRGMILPSANGTLQLQHAAEVAAAGNVTVRQGSFGRLSRIR